LQGKDLVYFLKIPPVTNPLTPPITKYYSP